MGDPLLNVPAMPESVMVYRAVVFSKLADPISERVSVEMVDVRYLKTFNAHYGEDTNIGNALLKLQTQCFQFEEFGIPISTSFLEQLERTRVKLPKKSSLFDSSSSDDES